MIDEPTVRKILGTADIVEVVSDFVSLKRRGANWVGLCPFHNDRTPSFYVSRAKGICKCFSCGKGGSAVNFIMEHEQMTYPDALRYLAAKYHIEIKEREITDEERQLQSEREALIMLNEWACRWMEDQLWETEAGRDIGLTYFRERGFSDAIIRKFRLGYSPEKRTALYDAAVAQGFSRDLLFTLGLCKDDLHGGGFDFYRGRVMFPIFNVAGKVIAFGGRTLKKDDHAKYFNSPDSAIYHKKDSTMYGLFQAKREISKQDKCFIVEGYADVISMHQTGFENVIASSGTALTEGHIHLIHRFTQNVTELFDGDTAGINAALKGIDKLLAAGLNIKVLPLPEGEDPDSFAQSHSSSEVKEYIEHNETDFISFKSKILLGDVKNDPIRLSAAITDVVKSIAVIPSPITRSVYAKDCANIFGVNENTLLQEISKHIRINREEEFKRREREKNRREAGLPPADEDTTTTPQPEDTPPPAKATAHVPTYRQERAVMHLIAKFGMCYLCDTEYEDGISRPNTVVEYLNNEMMADGMAFKDPVFATMFNIALETVEPFYIDLEIAERTISENNRHLCDKEIRNIDPTGLSIEGINKEENRIKGEYESLTVRQISQFRQAYLEKIFIDHPDDDVRRTGTDMVSEKHQLSKIHTAYAYIPTEFDRLGTLVEQAIFNWKNAIIDQKIAQVQKEIKESESDSTELLTQLQQLYFIRQQLAKLIGERVVNPRKNT